MFPHGAGFVLAFEFMQSDLAEVMLHAQRPLAQAQVKSYLQMLLKGVAFCHANNIVHRVSPGRAVAGPAARVGQTLRTWLLGWGRWKGQGLWVSGRGVVPQGVGTWADPAAQSSR